MPITELRRVTGEIVSAHGHYGVAGLATPVGIALVKAVRETFTVSSDAARVRLERSGIVGLGSTATASLFGVHPAIPTTTD
jgi:Na+/glutamate symporter